MSRTAIRWLAFTLTCTLAIAGCFQEERRSAQTEDSGPTELSGELFEVARSRGLDEAAQRAAVETFVPTGSTDTQLGFVSTGSSGRLAIVGLPSMRILKYVGVFTPEPWQGFGYDDESAGVLRASAREDIEYRYGDSGQPALSERGGRYDGKALFMADAANGRLAVVHLDDFETKQVLSNPVFPSSAGDVAVGPDTAFVVQTSRFPGLPGGEWGDPGNGARARLRGGLTFWSYHQAGEHGGRIDPEKSFTLALPPYLQVETDVGKGPSAGKVFSVASCRVEPTHFAGLEPCTADAAGILHVVDLGRARSAKQRELGDGGGHGFVDLEAAVAGGAVHQFELPPAPSGVAISPDGRRAIITHQTGTAVTLVDLERLAPSDAAAPDAFGVPTEPAAGLPATRIDVGGASVDATFGPDDEAFVSVYQPGRIARIDLASGAVAASVELAEPGGRLMFTQGETVEPTGRYLVVMNKRPAGHLPKAGPHKPLNPILFDTSGGELTRLYDGSVPQATDLAAVGISEATLAGIDRYPMGTDPRSGELAPYRTLAGNERVEREGNRVHVFGTLIRSHIVPEIVEVEVGDVVTFHLTNLEQAKDQTHGFTVSTYNVHGSWEPGKVASVTLTASREGIFPFYCTEFCSALHLEMMGYMLVRPKGWVAGDETFEEVALSAEKAHELYEAKLETIRATQGVIDSVVTWLKENDFESNPRAAALVVDATNQLAEIENIQPRIDAAVEAENWNQARLWAEQLYQYQVKAADAGLRAKKILSEEQGQTL